MRRRPLFEFEKRWARVLFGAIVPRELHPDVPESAGELGADEVLNALYTHSSFLGSVGFRGGLWLVWLLPPFVIGGIRLFGGLSPPEANRYLTRLYHHRFYLARQLVLLMKLVACMGYFRHPKVRDAFGIYREDAADLPTPRAGVSQPERA